MTALLEYEVDSLLFLYRHITVVSSDAHHVQSTGTTSKRSTSKSRGSSRALAKRFDIVTKNLRRRRDKRPLVPNRPKIELFIHRLRKVLDEFSDAVLQDMSHEVAATREAEQATHTAGSRASFLSSFLKMYELSSPLPLQEEIEMTEMTSGISSSADSARRLRELQDTYVLSTMPLLPSPTALHNSISTIHRDTSEELMNQFMSSPLFY